MRLKTGLLVLACLALSACVGAQVGARPDPSRTNIPGLNVLLDSRVERPADLCAPYDPANAPPDDLVYHPGSYTGESRCDLSWHAVVVDDYGAPSNIYVDPDTPAVASERLTDDAELIRYADCLPEAPTYQAEGENRRYINMVLAGLDCYVQMRTRTHPDEPIRVLIFAHGGMVTQPDAIREAETLAPALMHDGYYPVFLIWNSGFLRAYRRYLQFTNSRGEFDARNVILFQPARLVGDIGSGVFQIPENVLNQGTRWYDSVLRQDLMAETEDGLSPSRELRYFLPVICWPDIDPEYDETKYCENDQAYRPRRNPVVPRPIDGFSPLWFYDNGLGNIIYPLPRRTPYDEDYWNELNGGLEDFPQETFQYQFMRPARTLTTSFAEVGRNAWDDMVGRTRAAIRIPPERLSVQNALYEESSTAFQERYQEDEDDPLAGSVYARDRMDSLNNALSDRKFVGSGGFGALIQALVERIDCRPTPADRTNGCTYRAGPNPNAPARPVEITFAGHSMGSLIGNEVARFFPEFPMHRIIYMAAAASVRDFRGAVVPYMDQQGPAELGGPNPCREDAPVCTHFYNLMLHPQRETREVNFYAAVPQGSLLEWIDEMFEDPRSADERTLGKWSNIVANRDLFSLEQQRRMMHRVFPVNADTRTEGYMVFEPGWGFEAECDDEGVTALSAALGDEAYGHRCHPLVHGEFNDFSFWRDRYLLGRFADYEAMEE